MEPCKYCNEPIVGKNANVKYCQKPDCLKKYRGAQIKERYANDPEFRDKKREAGKKWYATEEGKAKRKAAGNVGWLSRETRKSTMLGRDNITRN